VAVGCFRFILKAISSHKGNNEVNPASSGIQQLSLWTRRRSACPAGAKDCWETRAFPNNLFTRDHAFRVASTRFTTLEAWFTTLEAWFTTPAAW